MKRHPALQPLSREHHLFLTWCRNARWFARESPRAPDLETLLMELRGQLAYIEAHFRLEEDILFPAVEAALGKWARSFSRTLRRDHDLWRARIGRAIEVAPMSTEMLMLLARHLHDHIRFEERVFFPELQAKVTEEKWRAIADQLHP